MKLSLYLFTGLFHSQAFVEMYLVRFLEVSWQAPLVFIQKTQCLHINKLTYSGVIL